MGNCRFSHRVRVAGFTYLWTLILVAMMGVSLLVTSEIYSTTLTREKEKELLFVGHQFRDAIAQYYESNIAGGQHQYPLTLEDLLKDPRFPGIQRYLKKIYVDPMTGKKEWGTVVIQGRIAGIYSLSDKMPIKQDNFDIEDSNFKNKEKYSEWAFTYPADLLLAQLAKTTDGSSVQQSVNALDSQAVTTTRNVTNPPANVSPPVQNNFDSPSFSK